MSSSTLMPPLTDVLATSRSADGGRDADEQAVIRIERLQFRSLDEEMLIKAEIEELERQQQCDRWIGRAIGAGIGLFFGGMVDGFSWATEPGSFLCHRSGLWLQAADADADSCGGARRSDQGPELPIAARHGPSGCPTMMPRNPLAGRAGVHSLETRQNDPMRW